MCVTYVGHVDILQRLLYNVGFHLSQQLQNRTIIGGRGDERMLTRITTTQSVRLYYQSTIDHTVITHKLPSILQHLCMSIYLLKSMTGDIYIPYW